MGNSGLNCTQPEGRISANADIVGPGIMSAFFGTAMITIIAVVFAYLSGSFDDEFLNEFDRWVINGAKGKARRLWNRLRRKTSASAPDTPGSARSLEARKEAIVQFILTLSDQQLVTGMAILVSGIAHQRDLSGYEYCIMVTLAWFSSTTHLATLHALRTYLRGQKVIRTIRVCGMGCVLILLVYTFSVMVRVTYSPNLLTVPVQCLFSDAGDNLNDNLNRETPNKSDPGKFIGPFLGLVLIVFSYLARIADLFFELGIMSILITCASRISKSDFTTDELPLSRIILERRARETTRQRLRTLGCLEQSIYYIQRSWHLYVSAVGVYNESFLSSFTKVAFSFSYGVGQVVLYRWRFNIDLMADANYMGFGQIMALFLLVLPFLSAFETYYGYVEKASLVAATQPSSQLCHSTGHDNQLDPEEGHLDETLTELPAITSESAAETVHSEYDTHEASMSSMFPGPVRVVSHLQRTLGSNLDPAQEDILLEHMA
ncbi:hypothetical protein FDECE_3859 [Fusarium decemcellulare]|nr:hypothetical protein FDECE_3859 [Fusarium decemcellulare]